jgi:hypothetical protein
MCHLTLHSHWFLLTTIDWQIPVPKEPWQWKDRIEMLYEFSTKPAQKLSLSND